MSNKKDQTSAGTKIPLITVLPDHPVEEKVTESGIDLMNYEVRLMSILDIIRHKNTRCPITIALYGEWGTGKSSSMRWLQSQLEVWNSLNSEKRDWHPKVFSVWFDPWRFTKREDVWRGLIAEVILSCIKHAKPEKAGEKVKNAVKLFGRYLGKGFLHAVENVSLGVNIAGLDMGLEGKFIQETIDDNNRSQHPEKAYLNEFETAFKDWIADYLKTGDDSNSTERVAVFIDDLDRCLPEVTLEVLEALKLYLNIPQLIFIIGLDREVVDGVLLKHYEEHGLGNDKSKDYLGKIFQVEFNISPSEQQLEGFYEEQFETIDKSTGRFFTENLEEHFKQTIATGIKKLSRNNPRETKRMLNSSFIRGYEAALNDRLIDETHTGLEEEYRKKLRFAQGVQVFLLQKKLSFFTGGAAVMAIKEVQDWLSLISKSFLIARNNNKNYEDIFKAWEQKKKKGEEKVQKPDEQKKSPAHDPEIEIPAPPKQINFQNLVSEWVFQLLATIPFSMAVASTTVQKEDLHVPDKSSKLKEDYLGEFPYILLDAIAANLEKPFNDLEKDDLTKVTGLDLSGTDFSQIDLLSDLSGLQRLGLSETQVSDVSALSSLSGLQKLDLSRTQVSDVSTLSSLSGLQRLNLTGTLVNDISALSSMAKLQELYLGKTLVSDISPLSSLTGLKWLNLSGTSVSDVSALSSVSGLLWLDLSGTLVSDVSPLSSLNGLQELFIDGTLVSDLSALSSLSKLQRLNISGTLVKDISALSFLTDLKNLLLSATPVTDISALSSMKGLQELYLNETQVSDVSALSFLTGLQLLFLNGTSVNDVSALSSLKKLQRLYISGTPVSDISDLKELVELKIYR